MENRGVPSGPTLLSSNETYQIYEKKRRSHECLGPVVHHSPVFDCRGPPPLPKRGYDVESTQFHSQSARPPAVTSFYPMREKRRIPIAWIVTAAVAVPIFIIVCLFAAVWLQELGLI
ncbi:hypothetical protein QR680_008849 [Steinernema hermaphroditum]|uniref:Uncharacterized protein n=1 Tax=Steinernema hermaphroditum TaxID=289476 RepID=A0AA39II46_9BILA|nr:hypothetical protein QR680_008849 [Steinernema hermaphroditum]